MVKDVHKDLQARNVHFVLDYTCDRHYYLDEQAGQCVLDVLVFNVDEVLGALVEEVEAGLEVLDGNHLDAEVLHAHEELDDVVVGGRNDWRKVADAGNCRLEVGGDAG